MPRLKRVAPIGVPQHVIQRGNNRQVCFASEQDFYAYAAWLKEYADKFNVDVHAWVFMTNHVHLLCTPNTEAAVSKMMQSLGRMYVRYFNRSYGRTGTLWEGRFKSCLVDSESYLLELYRYIELNPVRASMVIDPAEYKWSSYRCNALGLVNSLFSPHRLYLALGETSQQRQTTYRDLFKVQISDSMISDIRNCTNKGLALGNTRFIDQIEALAQARVSQAVIGRPRVKA